MKPPLLSAYREELRRSREREAQGDLDAAFRHLERAHILGQRDTLAHARTHMDMLRVGFKRRDAREVLGQLPRILAALLFSRLWVPLGNTGGANVSAIRPMALPRDLAALLDGDN